MSRSRRPRSTEHGADVDLGTYELMTTLYDLSGIATRALLCSPDRTPGELKTLLQTTRGSYTSVVRVFYQDKTPEEIAKNVLRVVAVGHDVDKDDFLYEPYRDDDPRQIRLQQMRARLPEALEVLDQIIEAEGSDPES